MYYKLDFLLQYLEYKEMPCTFVLWGWKVGIKSNPSGISGILKEEKGGIEE